MARDKKIVLATGIYPPEIGGPATYVYNLKQALKKKGYRPVVVTYTWDKKLPTGLRHMVYAARLFVASCGAWQIWAFDAFSVGLPAAVVSFVLRKKLLIRIGGDFLWEQYVERVREPILLSEFYREKRSCTKQEHIIFSISRWVLHRAAGIICSTEWLLRIWQEPYRLKHNVHIVENAYDVSDTHASHMNNHERKKVFVLAARDIYIKNKQLFRDAFARYADNECELDERILPHDQHMERMARAHVVVIPSLSEVSPNQLLAALSLGKPYILTHDSGYRDRFLHAGILIDPRRIDDMGKAIERMCDNEQYDRYRAAAMAISVRRSYDDIAQEFIHIGLHYE